MSSGGGGSGVGMATNIVGSEMERWAAILAADEMNRKFSEQMKQQNMFRQQGMAQFGQYAPSLGVESANKSMQEGAANRVSNYQDVAQRAIVPGDKTTNSQQAALALQGQERARLGSYGDWQTKQGIDASQFQNVLSRIASRAGGSAEVFPFRMSAAQHSMDWLNMLGEMIKGVGGGSANFGMLNQQPPQQQQQATPQQWGAMQAGYGPVNAQYANSLYSQQGQGLVFPPAEGQWSKYGY